MGLYYAGNHFVAVPNRTAPVPQFLPYPGIRYAFDGVLDKVCAPPYDVIDADERAALLDTDPHNSVRLILPDTYDEAATLFRSWQTEGVLVADDAASFSIYRMTFQDDDGRVRHTTGVIGALSLAGLGSSILPHERTLPKAKSDRLELLRATRANLDPIWGLSLAAGLSDLLPIPEEPTSVARDGDGVLHELFRVDSPEHVEAIAAAVASASLVLADGHHRFETASTYAAERADAGTDDRGAAAIMAMVVELAPEQLWVQPIHRTITALNAVDLRAALADVFDVFDAGPNVAEGVVALDRAMHESGALGLVDRNGLALLVPRPELDARLAEFPQQIRMIDAARFDAGVVPVIDGAALGYRNDAATVATHVSKGTVDAAVLLRPVTVDQIRAAAQAGLRMPEKTTFFAPKPRTGMVFRSLDLS